MPAHVLIVGASGGIGLALAHRCATLPDLRDLVLCARRATTDPELLSLRDRHPGIAVRLFDLDIGDEASLATLSAELPADVPALDLAINATGLLHGPDLMPEKMLEQVTASTLHAAFAVNSYGPVLLAKHLLPWLKQKRPMVFASLSAKVGSIADNRLGGWYAYRASKAAQNQLLKTLAIELARRNPQAIVLALHPGTTETRLSEPFRQNVAPSKLFTPAFVAERLLDIMTTATPSDSGKFIGWDGQQIPW